MASQGERRGEEGGNGARRPTEELPRPHCLEELLGCAPLRERACAGSRCAFSGVVLREHRREPLGGWWQCVCFMLRDHSGKDLFCLSSLMNALALRPLFTRRVSANLRMWDSITSALQEGSRFPQCPCARG